MPGTLGASITKRSSGAAPPASTTVNRPFTTGLKLASQVKWATNVAGWLATRGGNSTNSSLLSLKWVSFSLLSAWLSAAFSTGALAPCSSFAALFSPQEESRKTASTAALKVKIFRCFIRGNSLSIGRVRYWPRVLSIQGPVRWFPLQARPCKHRAIQEPWIRRHGRRNRQCGRDHPTGQPRRGDSGWRRQPVALPAGVIRASGLRRGYVPGDIRHAQPWPERQRVAGLAAGGRKPARK